MITVQALIGFITSLFAAVGGYILVIEKRHKKERKEMADRDAKNFERLNEITDETNKVLRENTNILTGLKTLLENQRRNER